MAGKIRRRRFGAVVAGAATVATGRTQQQSNTLPAPGLPGRALAPDTPPFEAPLEFAWKRVPMRAEPFPMQQVRLLPNSIYTDAQEWNRGYMSRLEPDRLLYNFRANTGFPTGTATPLGGWEQPENGQRSSELRGHFSGHFLSALAQLSANGDKEAKAKGDYMVDRKS